MAILLAVHGILPARKINVLMTMARMPANVGFFLNKGKGVINSLALDSGVFSLQKSQINKTADELFTALCAFAALNKEKFDLVFNFDLEFGLESFDINMEYLVEMESEGIPAIPVVHNIYNDEVEQLIDLGHKVIAIGQCRGRTQLANLEKPVRKMHEAGVRVHLFGSTSYRLLADLPIWSCDSSSWVQYAKYGIVQFWNPAKDVQPGEDHTDRIYFPEFEGQADDNEYYYRDYAHRSLFEAHLDQYGITLDDLLGLESQHYRSLVNILYFLQLEDIITARHLELGWEF
jgi:hypothetical protein